MAVQVARDTFTVHRFTVEEYRRMGEAGIFPMGARLELIEGEIVEMSPIGDQHAWCVGWLNRKLTLMLQHVAFIWVQNPMQLSSNSEPQPDVLVLKLRDDLYKNGKPQPEDTLLVIEVSDSTLAYDRRVKVPLYARAGVPEVWIINLVDERVETFADPSGNAYRVTHSHKRGEEIQSVSLAALRLSVSEIFD